MNNLKAIALLALMIALIPGQSQAQLDSDSAVVRMSVAKFAQITGLDDFFLNPVSSDGDSSSIYSGSDSFNLESNCAVLVNMTGEQLNNGSDYLETVYALDDGGQSFETAPGIHNQSHSISAQATLGEISSQKAGDYAANIEITVSAL